MLPIISGRSSASVLFQSSLACLLTLSAFVTADAGLIITPTFDATITSNANSAQIKSTINQVIALYQSKFSDNTTVRITFKNMTSGLGQSSKPIYYVSTTGYLTALHTDSLSANDRTALGRLPTTSTDPVAHKSTMFVAQANLKALGYNMGTGSDGTISVNTSLTNITRTSINSSKYDLFAVVAHEIDEILGLGSGLNIPASYGGYIMPQDLFRYGSTSGQRSYTTSSTAVSYFSIDGSTRIVQFNQNGGGDFGDWFSTGAHTPRVQDAFGTPGVVINPGTAEYTGLDVIGYNPASSSTTTTKTSLPPPNFRVSSLGWLLVEIDPSGDTPVRSTVRGALIDGIQHPSP